MRFIICYMLSKLYFGIVRPFGCSFQVLFALPVCQSCDCFDSYIYIFPWSLSVSPVLQLLISSEHLFYTPPPARSQGTCHPCAMTSSSGTRRGEAMGSLGGSVQKILTASRMSRTK